MMTVPNDEVNSRKLNEKEYEVTETKDSKTIAGYKARKYNVKTKSGETFAVYASDALPMKLANYSPYSKIKGTPLEYEMSQGPYKMKVTAQAVNMGSETEASYRYDETGYTRMTIDQMKQMFGGGQKQDHGHDHSDPNHKH